jgi:hypothetical protein
VARVVDTFEITIVLKGSKDVINLLKVWFGIGKLNSLDDTFTINKVLPRAIDDILVGHYSS